MARRSGPAPAPRLQPELFERLDDDVLGREVDIVEVDQVSGQLIWELKRQVTLPARLAARRDLDPVGLQDRAKEPALAPDPGALHPHPKRLLEDLGDRAGGVALGQGTEGLTPVVVAQELAQLHALRPCESLRRIAVPMIPERAPVCQPSGGGGVSRPVRPMVSLAGGLLLPGSARCGPPSNSLAIAAGDESRRGSPPRGDRTPRRVVLRADATHWGSCGCPQLASFSTAVARCTQKPMSMSRYIAVA